VILYFAFWYVSGNHVGPEDVQDQEASVQEGQAEPPHPTVDQDEDRQHYPVQRQEEALEEDQAEAVNTAPGTLADCCDNLSARPTGTMLRFYSRFISNSAFSIKEK